MTLTISKDAFTEMLCGIIKSGATFEAVEMGNDIKITFTGGY
jgi:hypothetical protein